MTAVHRSVVSGARWKVQGRWRWWGLLAALGVAALLILNWWNGSGGAAPEAAAPTHQHDVVPAAATVTGAGSLPEGWTATSFGPLGPADRELLVRVRQAGLWENPAGLLARDRAADKRVKEVGAQLANDHHGLDEQVRQVAAQLGVALPDKATAEQQGWVQELTGKKGADFDVTFANRLRAAHGKVFGLVGAVRSGTQNELIRSFAQTAVNVVMKHMTLLESIGNVDYGALPTPAAAAASTKPSTADAARANLTGTSGAIWLVVALAVIAGVSSAIRTIRARRGTF